MGMGLVSWRGRHLQVAYFLALAFFLLCMDTVGGSGRVPTSMQRIRRRGGRAHAGSRRLLCRCGGCGVPPPPPPPPSYDCSTCPAGYYEESPCTSTSSRSCKACSSLSSTCASGSFLSGCGPSSSGTCTLCPSCQAGMYRSGCSGEAAGCEEERWRARARVESESESETKGQVDREGQRLGGREGER